MTFMSLVTGLLTLNMDFNCLVVLFWLYRNVLNEWKDFSWDVGVSCISCYRHYEGWTLLNVLGCISCSRSWLSCLGGGSRWSLDRWRSCFSQWWKCQSPLYIWEDGQFIIRFLSSQNVCFWKNSLLWFLVLATCRLRLLSRYLVAGHLFLLPISLSFFLIH